MLMVMSFIPPSARELLVFCGDQGVAQPVCQALEDSALGLTVLQPNVDYYEGDAEKFHTALTQGCTLSSIYAQGNVKMSRKKLQPLAQAAVESAIQ